MTMWLYNPTVNKADFIICTQYYTFPLDIQQKYPTLFFVEILKKITVDTFSAVST